MTTAWHSPSRLVSSLRVRGRRQGEITLETAVRRHLDPADPHSVYVGFVHRLDRPTSGVILWAKTEKAARRLAIQFQKRSALKEYWAIVESNNSPASPREAAPDVSALPNMLADWCGTTGSRAPTNGPCQCCRSEYSRCA